jgi:hypothetical protein
MYVSLNGWPAADYLLSVGALFLFSFSSAPFLWNVFFADTFVRWALSMHSFQGCGSLN